MTSALDVAMTILNFSALDYAAAPHVNVAAREDALLMSDFEGVAISGPAQAEPGAALPIAVAVRFDGARSWDAPIARNAALVSSNLSDGRVLITDPFRVIQDHKRHAERAALDRGARPPADQLEGVSAEITWTDAIRARIPVEPGEWRFTLLYHDWSSNPLTVTVAGHPAPPAAPAIFPAPNAGDGLPSYLARPNVPEAGPGGADFMVRVAEDDGVQRLWVTGAFQIRPRPWMEASGAATDQGTAQTVHATVPVTVILMGLNDEVHDFRVSAPIYEASLAPNVPVTGRFTLDLLEGADGYRLAPGIYAVWVVVDGDVTGPRMAQALPAP
jgi:hypothetical protein